MKGDEVRSVADPGIKLVTIMNYPAEPRYRQMCYAFLDSAIRHNAKSVTILYEDRRPEIAAEHRRSADIEIRQAHSIDVGHPHFNLRFKLPNLAQLPFPFLFIDADSAIFGDLHYLWQRRHDKPWIGIDHQFVPGDARTHRSPFLNSGVQLVSDPAFYDLDAILAAQNAVVPLSLHADYAKLAMFPCPGNDQAVLFRYFQSIGYNYTHPEIGPEWNSCAGVTDIRHTDGAWRAFSHSQTPNYQVHLVHYWSQFKPWAIECPFYASFAGVGQTVA
jgi:hypothetical protein